MFSKAIVRKPCRNLIKGITTANLGIPDYSLATYQHQEYINALRECGLNLLTLEADEEFPDSIFVEDTALLTSHCAIIANPGISERKGEIIEIKNVVQKFYSNLEMIEEPGTLEAGDVMMIGTHFYIGLSTRTNETGANQLIKILNKYGMTGSTITLSKVLHLKSGVSYLENNNLLLAGEFLSNIEFQKYNTIEVDDGENYAAASLWINDKVLVPKGFPKTKRKIDSLQ